MLILTTSALQMRMDKLREESPSVFKKLRFSIDLASSALLRKAKTFVVANIAYYAMSPLRAGAFLISFFADI